MNRTHYIYNIALLLLLGAATPLHAQTIRGNIYGGGQLASVTMNTDVLIKTGTIDGDVYGGGALANVDGNTNVSLIGGTLNSAYGGGLGSKIGVDDATENVEAIVGGNTLVTLNGSVVNENIFGCNNLNGTPKGHAKVHVLKTTPREGQTSGQYDVAAVYGGGNLAAYVPSDETLADNEKNFAEVLIENCDNSIAYVYGGGNAAPVPATKVTIKGANAIDNAFAGGNGAGQSTDPSAPNYNPGADIGYLDYTRNDPAKEYGTGIATINVQGGTIHHVYGGSNTLGYIKDHAEVNVNDAGTCPMDVTELYGGGKKAPGKAAQINITCTGEGKIENVYGGAHMADLTGNIELNIRGGNIGNAFGGNNESGTINGSITVNVDWATGDGACTNNRLSNVYGGGNKALYSVYGYNDDGTAKDKADDQDPIAGPTVNLINGTVSNNVYGGGLGATAVVTGNPVVNLMGVNAKVGTDETIADKTGGSIFGGGSLANTLGNPSVIVTIGSAANVYGGGALADVTGDTYVSLMGGTVGNAYGGGLGKSGDDAIAAAVSGMANIALGKENADGSFDGICVVGNIFGCNDTYGAPAHAVVTTYSGTVNNVYGGGNQAAGNSAPVVYLVGGAIKNNVYGGGLGESAVITGNPIVNLWGATVGTWEDSVLKSGGNIFGGGEAAPVKGNPMVSTASGTAGNVYAGGFGATAVVTGNPTANIDQHAILYADVDEYNAAKGTDLTADAFEALDNTTKTRYTEKTLTVQNVFGGGSLAKTEGDPTVNVSGGTVAKDVYGGGALADVDGNTSVILTGGSVVDAYGGGLGSADVAAEVGNSSVLVKEDANVNNVFGCNNTNGTPTGTVNVEIAGGTVNENVFGGGHLANATADPVVTVSGGTVTHDVYGGGALADVTGNTTVNLTGGAVGGAYGGALGQLDDPDTPEDDEAIAAIVSGKTTVTLNGTQITETGVFGANNLNGTPRGHAFVHVLSTTARDGQGTDEYDVPAVYGGGNLSAYEPDDDNDFAEVLIENCDNSIEYVYGGGNAAPVPATDVKIYGANAINHAFAGGNGAGAVNPGADVGYKGYFSQGHATPYGTGEARIKVLGGTVHNVYGGSNTLGYIRGGAYVSVDNPKADDPHATGCELNVGKVYGGGNEADIDCDIHMDLDCNEGGQILYAGANNANVHGNIILNIHSGTYGQVFCGNNTGGKILGKLQVNVDETGCWPVMIGELYACGNLAPYSVRGWHTDGNARTVEQFNALTADEKAAERFGNGAPYDDPEINLISFTRIGKVFGGGYGETAVLYGNTHVNVEPIPGIYADGSPKPSFILDAEDKRVQNTSSQTTLQVFGVDKIGSIGSIYGGGNAGAVYGNTNVNIGLKTTNHHLNSSTEEEVAVTITGNVFGGGNEAIVSGDTNVKIGN